MKKNKWKIPKELKDLAKFLEGRGYQLAVPFDNIRKPGYIATFDEEGRELIIDTGKCLEGLVTPLSGNSVLGNYSKSSSFSLKSFIKVLGDLFGLDFDFLKVRNVSISFPENIIKTNFITLVDIEEDWNKLSSTCVKKLANPANFLIVQALETSSIDYSYELKKDLTIEGEVHLEKVINQTNSKTDYSAKITYNSKRNFTISVADIPLTIGYKPVSFSITGIK